MNETHVQHPVRFIQHQELDFRKINRLLIGMIEQPARCSHQDIHSSPQLVFLRVDLHSAENDRSSKRQVSAIDFHALANLCSQFAGGSEDQHSDRAPAVGDRIFTQALQQGQREAGGFAGAGLSAGQYIFTFQNGGYRLALNRCGFSVALLANSAQEFGRQAESIK